MPDYFSRPTFSNFVKPTKKVSKYLFLVNIFLVIITFITTLIAGTEWTTGTMGPYAIETLYIGLPYSLSIMFILGCHEFGHYFASKYHGVEASLPYFIPFPPVLGFFHFGTMGAVIKTRSPIPNNKAMFDIGVAGPIAGFVACLIVLVYGFSNLPDVNYILNIHPDYFSPEYGEGGLGLEFGDTLLFMFLRNMLTDSSHFIPPMSEIYHYPYLCVGWFGLFVTAMNMVPVGQLDGGHVVYSMLGSKKHEVVASISMVVLIVLGLLGILDTYLELGFGIGWTGWLFWSVILYFIIKVKHPPVMHFENLGTGRMLIGSFSFLILLLSFSPSPFIISF